MNFTRGEILKGPDSLGHYHYALFWIADYHPGHPDGEHRRAERVQHFFGTLEKGVKYEDLRESR